MKIPPHHLKLLRLFSDYLVHTAGLSSRTQQEYVYYAGLFLKETFPLSNDPNWSRLTPDLLVSYLYQKSRRFKSSQLHNMVSSLRALLRFLQFKGFIEHDFSGCIPRIAKVPCEPPIHLSGEQINQLLCTASSLRNAAILTLLSSYGVRAKEVAQLRLQDLNWKNGTLCLVKTKGRSERLLPLLPKPGAAIARYLQKERPKVDCLFLFLSDENQALCSRSISSIVSRALKRAAINSGGRAAHLFRHSLATRLVQNGTPIKEVADLLGHKSLASTQIYARADLHMLVSVVQPWPGKELNR